MELPQLHKYVDLYFEGQATLEQEAILMDYFSQPVVDVKLAQFKPYFEAIASERKQTNKGELPVKPSSKTNWRRAVAIAAVAVLGFFMTNDGGQTWKNVLEINEWTGVTDLVIDHENSNILYAATWQKHRNVAAHMGGGPGTSLYKSIDNGETWFKINTGLPNSNLGKIGLAISPFDSSILYAAVETDRRKGGVYKTMNSGGSWKKMSDTVPGATGPHYYQELVASPHYFDKIYLMDVRVQVSDNGGKDFYRMSETEKHSDNHSLTFKESDPNYLLIGTDGGIYESFDNT